MSTVPPQDAPRSALPPVSTAVRQRLQSVFEHARRSAEKGERDYAHDLYTQCLIDDPANLIYLQHLLANLSQKFGNSKKGSTFTAIKITRPRMALSKAADKGQWREAFEAAAEALKLNPWDISTLLAVAEAYEAVKADECQLFVLRWAMDASPKDVNVNRSAGRLLGRMGQFDQAIGCWKRVLSVKPIDEEASKAVSQLGVEQAIRKGGYQQELLHGALADASKLEASVRSNAQSGAGRGVEASGRSSSLKSTAQDASERERELRGQIDAVPAEIPPYLELADLFISQERFREAQQVLTRALDASGGGDLTIRERIEDAQLRRAHEQVQIAKRRAEVEKSEEAKALAKRMAAQANQAELEVYAARSAREPGNLRLHYELGLRFKRAGKFREAIQAFQAASDDPRLEAQIQVQLGESFQHIRQFRLALGSFEAAIAAADSMQLDTRKLALYRAGVLALEMDERERAEKYLTELAAVDFGYRDVADRLDKLAKIRDSG
jgi:tetratricopeptide (TPR) repeat protein